MTLEEIDTLNCSVTVKEIGFNNIPLQKIPGPDDFTSECYLTSKEEISISHAYLQKIESEGIFLISFNSAYHDQNLTVYIFSCSFGELCFSRNLHIFI